MADLWSFDKLTAKRDMTFIKVFFVLVLVVNQESILHLINVIISCTMLEGKSSQNKAKQDKK